MAKSGGCRWFVSCRGLVRQREEMRGFQVDPVLILGCLLVLKCRGGNIIYICIYEKSKTYSVQPNISRHLIPPPPTR